MVHVISIIEAYKNEDGSISVEHLISSVKKTYESACKTSEKLKNEFEKETGRKMRNYFGEEGCYIYADEIQRIVIEISSCEVEGREDDEE